MQAATDELLARWRRDPRVSSNFVVVREMPARAARYADLPAAIDRRLVTGLASLGVGQLYSHQRQAIDALVAGLDVVVATPTASGKSLCYNLPVFDALLADPMARALYLYPTKALARDQIASLRELAAACGAPELGAAVFDGDTPG